MKFKEVGLVLFTVINVRLNRLAINNNNPSFDSLTEYNIPIYTYGSEVVLDYKLYTGPDNEGMAEANSLKDKVQRCL